MMVTRADDLKVGIWIAIHTAVKEEKDFGFRIITKDNDEYPVNGKPLKILAISLPFIAVTDGQSRYAIDIRECKVIRLDQHYVKTLLVKKETRTQESNKTYYVEEHTPLIVNSTKRKKKKDTRGMCPQCGNKLREFLNGPATWIYICSECGFQGSNK